MTPGVPSKRSPLKAIRAFCVECQGDSSPAVATCADTVCPFFAYRLGKALPAGKHKPTSTIKQYCYQQCQAGVGGREEVKGCQGNEIACPVFPFRTGRNPNVGEAKRKKLRAAATTQLASGTSGLLKKTGSHPG